MDEWDEAKKAMPEIAEEVEGLRTLDPIHDGSRDLLDRHGRQAVLKMWRKLHDGELKASDERDEARAEVERLTAENKRLRAWVERQRAAIGQVVDDHIIDVAARATVDSERAANAYLTEENEQLTRERDEARAEAERLRQYDPTLVNLSADGIEVAAPIIRKIADAMVTWLEHHNATNYTETEVHSQGRKFVLTVQRGEGRAPHQLRKDAEARAERAEKLATAAQTWAGDKVVGDPQADKRMAEAIAEYEKGE